MQRLRVGILHCFLHGNGIMVVGAELLFCFLNVSDSFSSFPSNRFGDGVGRNKRKGEKKLTRLSILQGGGKERENVTIPHVYFIYLLIYLLPPGQLADKYLMNSLQIHAAKDHWRTDYVSTYKRSWWFAKQVLNSAVMWWEETMMSSSCKCWRLPKCELLEQQVKLNKRTFHHFLSLLFLHFFIL